jgi:hypothetical protein
LYKKQKNTKPFIGKRGLSCPLSRKQKANLIVENRRKGDGDMSAKRIEIGKEAVEKLNIAQSCITEAYELFIESGLLPRNAKSICKNYINDLFKGLQ